MKRVVIVGGGISGLATAYRLQQREPATEITVLESASRPGGTIWTEQHDGFRLEAGPNGFLDNKQSTITLCRDLGLGDDLVAATESAGRNRYLYWNGKLQILPNGPASFASSRLLSWRGKVGLLLERFRRPRTEKTEESISDFARRRAGAEVADVLADAVVTGIHAGDPEQLSIEATFPRLVELEAKYGSVLRGLNASARERKGPMHMWSFRDGLRKLIETLAACLTRPPILGVTVRRIEPASDGLGWLVRGDGQESWHADALVLACPAYQQTAILQDLDADLADRIGGIAYSGVVVVGLGYRREDVPRDIDGFGYIAPQRLRRDVLGVQWCSSIFPDRAPPGMVLLRAMSGGWNRADVLGWPDERVFTAVRAELQSAMGITAAPVFQHIVRWERAIPQYHLGHLERMGWIEDRLRRHPGLFLGGNAYHGVSLNDCTEQADLLAERVAAYTVPSSAAT